MPLILGEVDLRWLRVLRLVRLLKISHYSTALEDLIAAVRSESSAFGAALYLFCIALFSSSLMYVVGRPAGQFLLDTRNHVVAPITLTTVGYGDVSPVTSVKLVGALAVMGVCVVALLTGIVASAFSNQISGARNVG